jgi:hypothetical protein
VTKVPEDQDRATVGLNATGWANMEAIMETGWFEEQIDAYRVAIAVALAKDLAIDEGGLVGVTTKWNRGTLDKDGRVKTLIATLLPRAAQRPYDYANLLADAGIRYLRQRLVDDRMLLSEVL